MNTDNKRGQSAKTLLALLRPYGLPMLGTAAVGALTILANTGLLAVSAILISMAALMPPVMDLMPMSAAVRLCGISRGLFRYWERLASHSITLKLLSDLRVWYYRQLLPLTPGGVKNRTARLFKTVTEDIETLKFFYLRVVAAPLTALLTLLAATVALLFFLPEAIPVLWVTAVLNGLILPLLSRRRGRKNAAAAQERELIFQQKLQDYVQGLEALWVYGRCAQGKQAVTEAFLQGSGVRQDGEVRRGRLTAISGIIAGSAMAATLFLGALAVTEGRLEGIYLLAVAMIVYGALEAVQPLPLAVSYCYDSLAAMEDMLDVTSGTPTGLALAGDVHTRDISAGTAAPLIQGGTTYSATSHEPTSQGDVGSRSAGTAHQPTSQGDVGSRSAGAAHQPTSQGDVGSRSAGTAHQPTSQGDVGSRGAGTAHQPTSQEDVGSRWAGVAHQPTSQEDVGSRPAGTAHQPTSQEDVGSRWAGVAHQPTSQEDVGSRPAGTAHQPTSQGDVGSRSAGAAHQPTSQEDVGSRSAGTAHQPTSQEDVGSRSAGTAHQPTSQEDVGSRPAGTAHQPTSPGDLGSRWAGVAHQPTSQEDVGSRPAGTAHQPTSQEDVGSRSAGVAHQPTSQGDLGSRWAGAAHQPTSQGDLGGQGRGCSETGVLWKTLLPPPDIAFSGVTFTYPGSRHPALDGVDVHFPAGSSTAIVGHIGSGKSSLAALLTGDYLPQQGQITLGGVPLAQWGKEALCRQISLVEQDPYLFTATLRENLELAAGSQPTEALWEALAWAELADLARSLPKGLDTLLSPSGQNFSAGERQRLALARMVLENKPVVILDEGLKHLDNITARRLLGRILTFAKGRTLLFITHDLRHPVGMDYCLTMEAGQVISFGKP